MKTERSDPKYKAGYATGYAAGRKRTEIDLRNWEAVYRWNGAAKTALEEIRTRLSRHVGIDANGVEEKCHAIADKALRDF